MSSQIKVLLCVLQAWLAFLGVLVFKQYDNFFKASDELLKYTQGITVMCNETPESIESLLRQQGLTFKTTISQKGIEFFFPLTDFQKFQQLIQDKPFLTPIRSIRVESSGFVEVYFSNRGEL